MMPPRAQREELSPRDQTGSKGSCQTDRSCVKTWEKNIKVKAKYPEASLYCSGERGVLSPGLLKFCTEVCDVSSWQDRMIIAQQLNEFCNKKWWVHSNFGVYHLWETPKSTGSLESDFLSNPPHTPPPIAFASDNSGVPSHTKIWGGLISGWSSLSLYDKKKS